MVEEIIIGLVFSLLIVFIGLGFYEWAKTWEWGDVFHEYDS